MKVKELMKQAYVIDKDMKLEAAAKVMSSKNIGCLILVSGKKVKGIITERDLLRNFNKSLTVFSAMTKEVITIEPNAHLQEALDMMNEHKIKKLPVVEKGEIVGIITSTDLLAHPQDLEGDFFIN